MKFRTVCAWCNCFIAERDCPVSEHCKALAIDGIIFSHGICKKCKESVETKYKLKLNGGNKNV